jgi:hypothetical protein
LAFVAEIVVLLPQRLGLRRERRHLPIGRAGRAPEDKVARRQRQQSADNGPLIPAKIIQRTDHSELARYFTHPAYDGPMPRRISNYRLGRGTGWRTLAAALSSRRLS